MLETGDIGGDYFSRLTCYMENLGWLTGSEPGPRRAAGPRKRTRPGFAHFCTQKASGDEAVTFRAFLGQKAPFWDGLGVGLRSDVWEVRFLPGTLAG